MEQSILITLPLKDFLLNVEATVRKVFTEQQVKQDVLLTSSDVIEMFKISTTTLQAWRDTKKIPFERIGNKIFYSRAALLNISNPKK